MGTIINIVTDYGFGAVVFLGIGYLLYLYARHRLFPSLKGKALVNKLGNEANLAYHSLFANINHRLNVEIPTLDLLPTKPVKQQMIRDILMIYTKTLFKTCKDIASLDMKDWSTDKWCDEMTVRVNDNVVTFLDLCKTSGVPQIVMLKFMRWHKSTQDILFDGIMSLGSSNIFNSNVARTNTLFFMVNLLLVTTIADAEKTLKELNGDVHGQFYNGSIIED
jgi:hypothetical protein